LSLHRRVYHLNRFTVDPYQIGKDNYDGIQSGAFWLYYQAGFRPLKKEQKLLAACEALKIKTNKDYRSSASVLKKLADSRAELKLNKKATDFDATDLSTAFAALLKNKFNSRRKQAETAFVKKLSALLGIKNYQEEKMQFILKNWSLLLCADKKKVFSHPLKKSLKKLFQLKAFGREEEYIKEMQRSGELRTILERAWKENTG
jgi:hypothetical protein